MRKARGPFTPETLWMQCIHGDIWDYRTKIVTLEVEGQTFTCWVGVVPRLDCEVLIGRDYPLLTQLLKASRQRNSHPFQQGLQAEPVGMELPLHRTDIALLMRENATLRFALQEALENPPPQDESNHSFTIDHGLLYRWLWGRS